MSKSSPAPDIGQLLQTAHAEGDISAASLEVLSDVNIGAQIQAALGISVDDVQSSEVVLVTQDIDDSGSIRMSGRSQDVRDGSNMVIDALKATKQKSGILAMTRYINGTILFPYGQLDAAVKLDRHNYDPNLGTPLYDSVVETLGAVVVKMKEFADAGVAVRSVTLIVTDGEDVHSQHADAADCRELITKLLMSERHIVAGMGVDNGNTDFRMVFKEMGIPDEWILTPGNTPSEVRKAFQLFSQSAVRASQGAANFSATALGGFATP